MSFQNNVSLPLSTVEFREAQAREVAAIKATGSARTCYNLRTWFVGINDVTGSAAAPYDAIEAGWQHRISSGGK